MISRTLSSFSPSVTHRVQVARVLIAFVITACATNARAQSLTALSTFGNATPGWRQAGEILPTDDPTSNDGSVYSYLQIGNNERGLVYANNHLYLVSHATVNGSSANVRILDSLAGADLGGLINTGISGGTFAVNAAAAGSDGAIYVGNLTTQSTTSPFKVYKWANEASAPVVAYTGDAGLPGARVGDDLAGIGSGATTRIASGFSNSPSVTGNNGYTVVDPTAGSATAIAFPTPPNPGEFRLGLTFSDASHIFSKAAASPANSTLYYTSYSGSTGTLVASPSLTAGSTAEFEVAYKLLNGVPLLATQSAGDSHINVYNVADPTNPVLLATAAGIGTLAANGNQTGQITWGASTINQDGSATANLYGMRTNGGIRAFTFNLPSPSVSGDYNGNGVVDAADYVIWRKNLGLTGGATKSQGDGTGDGNVASDDYDFWRAHFANTSGGSGLSTAAVPEPNTAVMLVLSLLVGASSGARRR
jgi:hypothetical protein